MDAVALIADVQVAPIRDTELAMSSLIRGGSEGIDVIGAAAPN